MVGDSFQNPSRAFITKRSFMYDWTVRAREVLAIEIEGLQQVYENLDASFSEAVEILAACKGRVAITGIGKSGLIGRKMAATMTSTGTPAYFLHPVEGAHGDLGSIRDEDVVIAISYSGKSVEVNAILPALKSMGVTIIGITSGLASPMAQLSDVVLNARIPREACQINMIPTASTTATLALGDALAMCLMDKKSFTASDFKRFHPGGDLGQRLKLSVSDIMHENVPMCGLQTSLAEALRVSEKGGFGAVIVSDSEGRLEGVITDGDIRRLINAGGFQLEASVEGCMTKKPKSAGKEQSVAELMDIMEKRGITIVPVVDSTHKVIGIVHMHDILGKGLITFSA